MCQEAVQVLTQIVTDKYIKLQIQFVWTFPKGKRHKQQMRIERCS